MLRSLYLWFNHFNRSTAKYHLTTNFASLVVNSIITEFKTPKGRIVILASIVVLGLKKVIRRACKIIN